MDQDLAAAFSLLSADAVRSRAHTMLALGLEDRLPHFRADIGRLDDAANLVIATTKAAYPGLVVPFHSRWRHFIVNGEDRYAVLDRTAGLPDRIAKARAAFDLAIVSVLLDAGAGPAWRFCDPATGAVLGRSEGLALASLDMFGRGVFSARRTDPLRADAARLIALTTEDLGKGFQFTQQNRFSGLAARTALLNALGECAAKNPDVFARNDTARPGGLFDYFVSIASDGTLPASTILSVLLRHFGSIWPSRLELGGVPLGDCWRHPALTTSDATSGLVPLHKLSQWLAYSLIEPLQQAGIVVTDIDGLTGLAEYRNGGLFVDTGVLVLRNPEDALREHDVANPLVVEWRALTVALLDRLAGAVRNKLNVTPAALPLASVLEGGSWAAGRALAYKNRMDGASPIKVVSDGTVF
ncbi:MAG: URC4/urg3 family protein [Xanthobacteraceae bacterium]